MDAREILANVPMESTIKNYLSGNQKYKKGAEGPQFEDFKINNISKKEFKKDQLNHEIPELTQKECKELKIDMSNSWKSIEATPEEVKKFQQSLWKGGQRTQFNTLEKELSWSGGEAGEMGKFLLAEYKPKFDKILDNGEVLYGAEAHAINIYSGQHYLLINGTLDNDDTSLKIWGDLYLDYADLPQENLAAALAEGQSYVNEIAKLAASGINKLPPFIGQLYRGDAMSNAQLDEWRNGKIMMTTKFFSCSSDVGVGEKFARQNAMEYMQDKGEEYKPVLYVFNSKSAKDISQYSDSPDEEERIYTPGQAFRSVGVDETTVPGLAIIFMEEVVT
jgi:hypothetical protein